MAIWDSMTSCFWFQPEYKRNTLSSMVSGILFFSGWWFLIDSMALYPHSIDAIHVILGILGTISLVMVNTVSQAQMNGDVGYSGGCMEARGARIWMFVGYVLGFAAIIAAIWVMVAHFNSADEKTSNWPGVSLLLQNVFIFVASVIYKFGRTDEY